MWISVLILVEFMEPLRNPNPTDEVFANTTEEVKTAELSAQDRWIML
ncbi:MAG: hypothetical protein ABL962_19750 [Fimbriimonadaceae bacterium]